MHSSCTEEDLRLCALLGKIASIFYKNKRFIPPFSKVKGLWETGKKCEGEATEGHESWKGYLLMKSAITWIKLVKLVNNVVPKVLQLF